MAGGSSEHLSVLTETRAEPAVPFGGKFRLIDFPLSNCVNSGIYNVAVLTQYKPRSLNDHIGIGKPWDLDRARGRAPAPALPRRPLRRLATGHRRRRAPQPGFRAPAE
jgi:ADP-glucose pyrophosphorylase